MRERIEQELATLNVRKIEWFKRRLHGSGELTNDGMKQHFKRVHRQDLNMTSDELTDELLMLGGAQL